MNQDVLMDNGTIFSGDKISELVKHIINKFADEKLSPDEAKIVLERTKNVVGEYAVVQRAD